MPTDYTKAKIYKLIDNTNNNIYIGSTCEPILSRRLAGHVSKYKSWKNGKYNYVTSFDIIKNNNYDIVLIEAFPCNNKDELHKRERHFIESMNCINKFIPSRTKKEYQLLHANKIKEYKKEYYLSHADEIKKKASTIIECSCGSITRKDNKRNHEKTDKHKSYIANQIK